MKRPRPGDFLAKGYAKYPGNPFLAVPYAMELQRKWKAAQAKKKAKRK